MEIDAEAALRPKRLIFLGNMGGASERDRTSDLLITKDLRRTFRLC